MTLPPLTPEPLHEQKAEAITDRWEELERECLKGCGGGSGLPFHSILALRDMIADALKAAGKLEAK